MKKIRFLLLALVALVGINASAKTVYIQPNAWSNDNAVISLNVWGDGTNTWVDLTEVETGILKATFDDSKTTMAVVRGTTANQWKSDGAWNQTGDITITDGKLYKLYDWDNSMDGIYVGHGVVEEDYTEPVPDTSYKVDFNTSIATSANDFAVASNWGHLVDYVSSYDNHMRYSYNATAGVDGTGAIIAYQQLEYDWGQQSSGRQTYDLLITPSVKGEVTLAVKMYNSTGYIEFYNLTDNGDGTYTRSEKIDYTIVGGDALSQSAYVTVSISVADFARIGIRASNMYLDNFVAQEANIIPEKGIMIASADPTATTGTIYWNQQANGKVLVKYTVTVKNTGDVDLTQGTEDYSVSIFNRTTNDVYCTVPVPQDLAVGATSDPFDVEAEIETSVWPNTYTYYSMDLRENLKGTVVQRAQSGYKAYQSKFIFRAAESTSTSSISAAEAWGTITESTTKSFEIYNDGLAPLTISSITLPEGFTSDNAPVIPVEGLVINGKEKVTFSITQDATVTGTFAGTLTIAYVSYGSESATNYTLNFSATVIGANTWAADFNGDGTKSSVTYPAGAIAEAGISSDYVYNSSTKKYDVYLTGRTTSSYASENNKFITPKLHATAGAQLSYDVKGAYGSSYYAKVYVSTDRKNWNQVAYYTQNATDGAEAIGYSNWYTKTVTFDTEGDYYVAFALYGTFKIDNLVGLEKCDVAHDLYIKSVNWPDASIKSNTAQTKPSVEIIPLTDEVAENYTVKYIYGENVVEIASEALTASANSTTTFAASFTPVVEATTTFTGTKVVFEFTDGTKFETETFDLTVTNEAVFHFLNSKPTSKWYEPTDRTEPIAFGKTNTADTQNFVIFNWGSAPLTVNSISLPEGFTTTTVFPLTVAAFNGENDGIDASSQALDITFSATAAGNYSGNMIITYNGDKTFTLPISGTKLDPSKFYANFDDGGWPAGSVYQSNINSTNGGTYSTPNYYITSSSATDNIFVTPKLTATVGEKLMFNAKLYSSYWSEGKVVVYAAATREEVLNAEEGTTRVQLFSVSGQDAEGAMTTDYQTFEVPALAGDYFYGFEISNRPFVDEIYGLSPVAVAHDLTLKDPNIPAEGTQNATYTASVYVQNFGITDDEATVMAYVDGVAVVTSEAVAIPMNHKLTDAGTQLSVSFVYPKAKTASVYLEVKAGETVIAATEAVNVVFLEEVAVAEGVEVGTKTNTGRDYGFVDWYNNDGSATRYTDILYPAAKISAAGIKAGDKITAISFKGSNSAKTFKAEVTSWVGVSTGDITYGTPDKAEMQEIVLYSGNTEFPANLESVINLPTPIVWDGTSDIRVYTEAVGQGSGNWMSVQYAYDNEMTMSYNGTTKYAPLAYFTLAAEPATLSGTVKTSGREAIANATVTLKAENGVEYSGTTDAEGHYSFNVIQAGLDFTATVEAEGYLKKEFAYNLGGESKTLDVTLYQKYYMTGSFPCFDNWATDLEMTQSDEDPNVFTLIVPDVALEATTYQYKLHADGIWKADDNDGYQLPAGATDSYSWEIHTAGTYTLKFTADVANHTLTFERPFTLAENADGIAALNWVDVTIEREFKAGWNAVVLPFGIENDEFVAAFGANSEVAVYDGDTNNNGDVSVRFVKQSTEYKWIEAGVPYLIWLEQPVSGLKFTKDISSTLTTVEGTTFDFVGTYSSITAKAGDYFIAGGKFVKATTNNTVKPFRSYLKAKGAGVRSVTFVIGEEATEIEGLTVECDYANDAIYNLNGQKVQQPTKRGLYIINGKKVMVK